MKKNIVLIYGGKSPEHEVSCDSAASIAAELISGGHEVNPVYISRQGKWILQAPREMGTKNGIEVFPSLSESCFASADNSVRIKPDVIFPIIHGKTGEDGIMQGFFELMDIPYAGSGVMASACGMNKAISKEIVKAAGINVLPHVTISVNERNSAEMEKKLDEAAGMGFPLFVKPVSQGSSVGITKVKDRSGLIDAVNNAFRFDTCVMAEKGVDRAREFVCGVLGNAMECKAAPAGEVCVQGSHEFYDYEAKYLDDGGMKLVIPAPLDKNRMDYICDAAVRVFKALGCSGFARVDFFADRTTGEIWFGEINTAPGFTSHSLYPALWKAAGVPVIKVLEQIIDVAIKGNAERKKLEIIR
ncbi:MAG: D-alanine--D-alanine ligase [Elusimicrobiales bacterium]|nr:D-alanine--D-alanine ligase [Elusimicrobiales bacterium]